MLALLLLAQLASAQPETSWNSEETAHFTIHHENAGASLGGNNQIERIYESLHPDLWRLVPWMTQKKISVYVYGGRDSFLKGRFHPPPWSGGLLSDSDGEKVLAVYEPVDPAVAAHELTHLYFHTFFDEKRASPPVWLDEGLATMLQSEALTLPDPRDKGPVLPAPLPLSAFLRTGPARDAPSARVSLWYRQAHSLVRFIKRAHIEDSFAQFCGRLRDGEDLESVLRGVYGYPDLAAFERAWLSWRPRKAAGLPD
jgi:hypothetical protein